MKQNEYKNLENNSSKIDLNILEKLHDNFNIDMNLIINFDKNSYTGSRLKSLDYWIDSVDKIIDHDLTIGILIEQAVRSFLKEFIPEKYGIEKGFIESIVNENLKQKEHDIIFTQKDYGIPLGVYESCKIFPFESVLGIMGVTKTLTTAKLKEDFGKVNEILKIHKRKVHLPGSLYLQILLNTNKTYMNFVNTVSKYDDIKNIPIAYLEQIKDIFRELIKEKIYDINIDNLTKESILKYLEDLINKNNITVNNLLQDKSLRNSRYDHYYGDMPLRYFYFAYNIDSSEDTFIKNVDAIRRKNEIPLHGMFILKRRLFISSMGGEAIIKDRNEKSYPAFIYSLLDGLNNQYHIERNYTVKIDDYLNLIDKKYKK